ncbi:hypothetical protein H4R19_003506 [Coemansia spiralis]|nr:hypothetical protein H4R19_003506 [Coemansia spiralis]
MGFLRRQTASTPAPEAEPERAPTPPSAPRTDRPHSPARRAQPGGAAPDRQADKPRAAAPYDHRDPLGIDQKTRDKKMKRLRRHAKFLDAALTVPCTCGRARFGVDALIGLVPVVGDFAGVVLALLYVSMICREFHTPATIKTQMFVNVAIDFVVGLVPLLGDIVDVMFKANLRNFRLIESHVDALRSSARNMEMGRLDADGRLPRKPSPPVAAYLPSVPLRPDARTNAARIAKERIRKAR